MKRRILTRLSQALPLGPCQWRSRCQLQEWQRRDTLAHSSR